MSITELLRSESGYDFLDEVPVGSLRPTLQVLPADQARWLGYYDGSRLNETIEHVNQGALMLDEVRPGWYGEIDVSKLDLADGERCVAGQLFVTKLLDEMGEDDRADNEEIDPGDRLGFKPGTPAPCASYSPRYGFNTGHPGGGSYEVLNSLWSALIEARILTDGLPYTFDEMALDGQRYSERYSDQLAESGADAG